MQGVKIETSLDYDACLIFTLHIIKESNNTEYTLMKESNNTEYTLMKESNNTEYTLIKCNRLIRRGLTRRINKDFLRTAVFK